MGIIRQDEKVEEGTRASFMRKLIIAISLSSVGCVTVQSGGLGGTRLKAWQPHLFTDSHRYRALLQFVMLLDKLIMRRNRREDDVVLFC